MINVYIGYDSTESLAYHVLCHSIAARSSMPVTFTPIQRSTLLDLYARPREDNESTDFSMTRFLAPFLGRYQGWGIYMDCDMLCLADIAELWKMRDYRYAVQCVQHDYTPKSIIKMRGNEQAAYPKKNWSSLMLMNFAKCVNLTPSKVSTASGAYLHQFKWVDHECEIGDLPVEWNHLVGEYELPEKTPKMLHWTLGGPWWPEFQATEYAKQWVDDYMRMMSDESGD